MADPKLGRQKTDGESERQMFEPTTGDKLATLLETPMTDWCYEQERLESEEQRKIVSELDGLIEKACRLRAYLNSHLERADDHARAVRQQNALATKVRRLLGYSCPKQDVTF